MRVHREKKTGVGRSCTGQRRANVNCGGGGKERRERKKAKENEGENTTGEEGVEEDVEGSLR